MSSPARAAGAMPHYGRDARKAKQSEHRKRRFVKKRAREEIREAMHAPVAIEKGGTALRVLHCVEQTVKISLRQKVVVFGKTDHPFCRAIACEALRPFLLELLRRRVVMSEGGIPEPIRPPRGEHDHQPDPRRRGHEHHGVLHTAADRGACAWQLHFQSTAAPDPHREQDCHHREDDDS